MSAPDRAELARRLFGSVRHQRPSAELEARILAAGRAALEHEHEHEREHPEERTVDERADLSGAVRRERNRAIKARWWLGMLAAAGLVIYLGLGRTPEEGVLISAERSVPLPLPGAASEPASGIRPPPAAKPEPALDEAIAPGAAEPERANQPAASVRARSVRKPALPEAHRPSLGSQLEQIKMARTALRAGDHRRALELLEAYRAQPAGAAMAAEASLLRIEALAASGQREVAARAARQFASDFPNSPLIDRALSYAAGGSER